MKRLVQTGAMILSLAALPLVAQESMDRNRAITPGTTDPAMRAHTATEVERDRDFDFGWLGLLGLAGLAGLRRGTSVVRETQSAGTVNDRTERI